MTIMISRLAITGAAVDIQTSFTHGAKGQPVNAIPLYALQSRKA